MENEVK